MKGFEFATVGKYVGWTAPTIQRKFKEAAGGILFIDEAYSLVDDRDGSFGDEAINTIVQEMENCRDEVIVIFAGYVLLNCNGSWKYVTMNSKILTQKSSYSYT